jgi:hypothetical protein
VARQMALVVLVPLTAIWTIADGETEYQFHSGTLSS